MRTRSALSMRSRSRDASDSTRGVNCAMVPAMASDKRRERRNHIVPRSISRLASISISICSASSTLLSSASTSSHNATKPKISRVSRYARTTSCGLAPDVSISR